MSISQSLRNAVIDKLLKFFNKKISDIIEKVFIILVMNMRILMIHYIY